MAGSIATTIPELTMPSPTAHSREFYKGVLAGASRAVFNGKVIVHADAQHSDADQSNRNLLLSDNAEVDTKPQLEIYADDVKCSHGATVGQLNPERTLSICVRAAWMMNRPAHCSPSPSPKRWLNR